MRKIYLFLIIVLVLLATGWLFIGGDKNKKDFIDLDNSYVVENESSVNPVNIGNKEMIQVRFSWEVNGIKYNDALNFTKDQYEKMSQEDIQKMKEERFVNWVKTVNYQSKQDINFEDVEIK